MTTEVITAVIYYDYTKLKKLQEIIISIITTKWRKRLFYCLKTHPATGMAVGSDHVECRYKKKWKKIKKQYKSKVTKSNKTI
jgi:hypothetical protein